MAWRPLAAILAAGIALRIALMAIYPPTLFNYHAGDAMRYMRLDYTGITGLFDDTAMPAGYPAFLALLRAISDWLPLTIAVQHALGIVTAALLYAAVVRFGAPRWAALLPAIVVAFSGDQLFTEHGVLTEALWMPLLALAAYLLARAAGTASPAWWLVAAGLTLSLSALVRNASLALLVLLALWAAVALKGPLAARLRNAALVTVPGAVLLGAYVVTATTVAGGYAGLDDNSGFSLYGRVGQFADCTKFTPPAGTGQLCVDTPPAERPGPFFWTYGGESPIRTRMGFDTYDPGHQALLVSFARSAIAGQPLDYAQAVATDTGRFFGLRIGTIRPLSGADPSQMSFDTPPKGPPEWLAERFSEAYSGVGDGQTSSAARTLLGTYQAAFRVGGLLTLALLALTIAGVALGRGPTRAGASLFLVSGVTLLLIPPLLSSYDVRYVVQPVNLLAAGAALGLAVAISARRVSRQRQTGVT